HLLLAGQARVRRLPPQRRPPQTPAEPGADTVSTNVNEPKLVMLAVRDVYCDPACMPRAKLDPGPIPDLGEGFGRGGHLPQLQILFDGEHRRVCDGWHTLEAHKQAKHSHVPALVRPGSRAEGKKWAAGANKEHKALKRSLDDRRRSVLLLLEALDEQNEQW